jgi:hypothetical protein
MYYLHICAICGDSEKTDSIVCENIKPLPSDMPVCDLLEEMSLNLKSRIVIFSIQSYRGSKLVKLMRERESYDIGGLLTEGRKGF